MKKLFLPVAFSMVGLFLLVGIVEASHFRGAMIHWTRTGDRTVEIKSVSAWRSAFIGSYTLDFGDGTSVYSGSPPGVLIGEFAGSGGIPYNAFAYTVTHTYPDTGQDVFEIYWMGCCRISQAINASNGDYRSESTVDLAVPFTGNQKGGPVTTMPFVVHLGIGPGQVLPVVATDRDGDDLVWSLASQSDSGIPAPPSVGGETISIDPGTGVLSWDTSGAADGQIYALAVRVDENRPDGNNGSTALDFLIEITDPNMPPTCSFDGAGIANNVIGVGEVFQLSMTGVAWDGANLSVSNLGLPPSATLVPTSSELSPLTTTFSWMPAQADLGSGYAVSAIFTDSAQVVSACSFTARVTELAKRRVIIIKE